MANVTEAQLRDYLQTFHAEYTEACDTFLPQGERKRLVRYALLPASIIGYVSTQLGAGYEYTAGGTAVETRRSSKRIEDLFVGSPNWLARVGPFFAVGGTNIRVHGGTFDGAFPFRFTSADAEITFSQVRFTATHWKRDVLFAHLFANRTAEYWSEAQAVRRARDEVLQALFDLQQSAARHVDLGTYLSMFKEKTVLLLGDFNRGRDRLEAIRAALAQIGYSGVLLDEIPEEPNYDLAQKFQAVASVCRFLVFEDSTPSGHIAEMMLAQGMNSVRVILREGARQSTYMTQGMGLTSKIVHEWSYDADDLASVIREATSWAESVVTDLAVHRQSLYPWRD